jgi:hypothetical protein
VPGWGKESAVRRRNPGPSVAVPCLERVRCRLPQDDTVFRRQCLTVIRNQYSASVLRQGGGSAEGPVCFTRSTVRTRYVGGGDPSASIGGAGVPGWGTESAVRRRNPGPSVAVPCLERVRCRLPQDDTVFRRQCLTVIRNQYSPSALGPPLSALRPLTLSPSVRAPCPPTPPPVRQLRKPPPVRTTIQNSKFKIQNSKLAALPSRKHNGRALCSARPSCCGGKSRVRRHSIDQRRRGTRLLRFPNAESRPPINRPS